jgi:hypothetical protein
VGRGPYTSLWLENLYFNFSSIAKLRIFVPFLSELSEANTILLGDKRQVESLLRGLQQEIDDLLIRYFFFLVVVI